jgi:hypothetical protein
MDNNLNIYNCLNIYFDYQLLNYLDYMDYLSTKNFIILNLLVFI